MTLGVAGDLGRPSTGGAGLPESAWDALPTSGLADGSERIVTALGATTERLLARVVDGQQTLVAPSTAASNYVTAHPMPPPLPAQVTGVTGTGSSGQVILSWSAAQYATTYKVYRTVGAGTESLLATTTNLTITDTGLTNGVPVQYRVIGSNAAGNGATSSTVTSTPSALLVKSRDILVAQFGNALIQDVGLPPVEGVIPAGGRTFTGQFERQTNSTNSDYRVYGIRAALVNQRQTPISGAKMIMGCRTAWRGDYLPDAGGAAINSLTQNPLAGWASLKIGGSASLPIAAASSDRPRVQWTDWLPIPGGFVWNTGGIMWRFWHPGQDPATDYTLTYALWGENEWERRGTVYDSDRIYNRGHTNAGEFAWNSAYFYSDGDGVTDPSTKAFSAFSAQKSPDGSGCYGPPGPGSYPFIQIQLSMEPI